MVERQRTRRIGTRKKGDDRVRGRDLLDVFHVVVLKVVVAEDLNRLLAAWERAIRVLGVGDRARGYGGIMIMLDVLWAWRGRVEERRVVGGGWRGACGNKEIAGNVRR